MKRLLCSMITVVMAVFMTASAMAATASVSVKNNVSGTKPVTYTYDSEKSGEVVESIKPLMTKLNELPKQKSVVQTITVTSESTDAVPVSFKLRLSIPEKAAPSAKPEAVKTPSPDEYSSLDYYNIEITDAKGDIIYSYEKNTDDEIKSYKDIPLGTLNEDKSTESRIFNITLSVNKDMNKSSIAKNAENLEWNIVSDTYINESPQLPMPTQTPAITVSTEPEKQPEPSQEVKEDKNGVIKLAKGEYLCGKDIDPGRYTMSGSGKVNVYTSEGVLKTTIALKEKNNSSANGVEEYIINLIEGEKITVENDTTFTPYTASSANPKATASPKSTAKATATPKAAGSKDDKSNPKTGDTSPIAGVSVLGAVALGAFVFLVIKNKKEN